MTDLQLLARRSNAAGQFDVPIRGTDDGGVLFEDRYQELALRGKVFTSSIVTTTLPVNAATLASKWGLYNPPGSGVFLDIIDVMAHYVVATTVVNALGVYYSNGSNATGATFTTAGVIENARVGEGVTPNGRAYSAVTHVGTPALLDIVGGWGAVTDGGSTPCYRYFGGKLLIPPSTLIAFAMTTAAATASSITGAARWAEIPYVAL